ncbi:MAG: Virginiamycin B lyase [Syntrophus sp. SKADARSKE-3]|nr:Virginiamycin B lyase [Syntrophus sp. SKADARSKE-3]
MSAKKVISSIIFMVFAFLLVSYTTAFAEGGYDFVSKWGSLGSGNGNLNKPHGIFARPSGNLYVADYFNNRIQVFSTTGSYVSQWGSFGTGNGNFSYPDNVAVDSSGNIYVSDENNHRIQKFTSSGVYSAQWGSQGGADGQFNYPQAIAIDSSDKVYVVDSGNNRIQVFTAAGVFSTKWGSQGSGAGQFNAPRGIAVDASGNFYVADSGNNRISKYTTAGVYSGSWGTLGTGDGQFNFPRNVAVDSSGNVYVTDQYNSRIQKFAAGGTFITKWGSYGAGDGQFDKPYGITVDSSGNVYVTDENQNRIQKFSPTTCTYTLSSTGSTLSALSNTGTTNVTSLFNFCNWTATASASWITITAGASGTGNSTVSFSVTENTGAARTGSITIGGQTFTIAQSAWTYSNSIGSRNSIKITDMSGSLSTTGATITVKAWDVNGNSLAESGSASPLKVYNNATTTITGTSLASRFSPNKPILYAFTLDSSKLVITNVKTSVDGNLNIPSGYSSGTTNFVTNSVGSRNSIKITDMSGTLSSSGAAVNVAAWDVNGISIPVSGTALPLTVNNNATLTISGSDLAARFPTGTPMSYDFSVASTKVVITNVKSSADNSINIPYVYTNGTTNFVANSIGPRNTIRITDRSGILTDNGAAITIKAWDTNGNSLSESGSVSPLTVKNNATTTISGTNLAARFPSGTPMSYDFSIASTKIVVTNTKSTMDTSINIPSSYVNGITFYASNYIGTYDSIKITDLSGIMSSDGGLITIKAWDANGNSIPESGSAANLLLFSYGTTSISGSALAARFPSGTPIAYEFSFPSSKYIITNITGDSSGTVNVPNIYTSGVAGGI